LELETNLTTHKAFVDMVCLATYMREVTLNFNDEDITIWAPNEQSAIGVVEMMMERRGEPGGIFMISEIAHAADMVWEGGPVKQQLRDLNDEMTRLHWGQAPRGCLNDQQCILDPEHEAALDDWRAEAEVEVQDMNDLHSPSLYTEWNQATGESNFIGADQLQKNMKIPKYTPEMLFQRDTLNWFYNFNWNGATRSTMTTVVPDTIELLELTAVGDNHGVAKCDMGAVFVPKSALNHLTCNGGAEVGTIFDGEITFTPGNKFPWRLVRDGVKFTYEDLCGTRPDDY